MAKKAIMKVWDVELGLAIHIKAPNGKYIVIDLGSRSDFSPMKQLRGKEVGYMVITHPHFDHFSDVVNVNVARPTVLWRCKSYTRHELLAEASTDKKEIVRKYCDFVETYNAAMTAADSPYNPDTFDGLTVNTFSTNSCNKGNKNNFSAVVVLQLGNAKVVVCGDNEEASWEELMKQEAFKKAVKGAWVLVAAHHGRESGYSKNFVSLVDPYITIVSDTAKGGTSVTGNYICHSKGYKVYNCLNGETRVRYCLTTRNDGNIEVTFGETDNPKSGGTLNVKINA